MANHFKVTKECGSAEKSDFYHFICAHYLHQDGLAWSRTQYLMAVEAGILAAAFLRHGWLAIFALVLGSILVRLIWNLVQRDWQVRDQFNSYFDEFHKDWGITTLSVPPKNRWYRGRHIIRVISWSVIVFNICAALGFAFEMYL